MLTVYLNRDEEPGSWTWTVEGWDGVLDTLEVPYDSETGDYDISSATLARGLVEDGFDVTTRHWSYIDGDYGSIGEWNRPEGV